VGLDVIELDQRNSNCNGDYLRTYRDGNCNTLGTWYEHRLCPLPCCTCVSMSPGVQDMRKTQEEMEDDIRDWTGLSAPACYKMEQDRQAWRSLVSSYLVSDPQS